MPEGGVLKFGAAGGPWRAWRRARFPGGGGAGGERAWGRARFPGGGAGGERAKGEAPAELDGWAAEPGCME